MKKKKVQKTNAMRSLEQRTIDYIVHEHEWTEDHTDMKIGDNIFKTLVAVGNNSGPLVACIPVSTELDLKALAKVSGNKKVDMLHMKDLEKTTGYIRGGTSPVGMKKQLPTFIASEAADMESIIISAGKRGMQMELKPDDLIAVTNGQYAAITE